MADNEQPTTSEMIAAFTAGFEEMGRKFNELGRIIAAAMPRRDQLIQGAVAAYTKRMDEVNPPPSSLPSTETPNA